MDASSSLSDLQQLLVPIPARETIVRPVGPAVNDTRYDGPECLDPPEPVAQQAALF